MTTGYAIVIPTPPPPGLRQPTSFNGFELNHAYLARASDNGWVVRVLTCGGQIVADRFITADGSGGAHLQWQNGKGGYEHRAETAGSFRIVEFDMDADPGYKDIPSTYMPVIKIGEGVKLKAVVDWHAALESARQFVAKQYDATF